MRRKIIAGNWKMNKSPVEGSQLVEETLKLLDPADTETTIVVFCPPFTAIERVASLVKGKNNIFVAAQNCHWEKSGAYTGEVSASMIKAAGASYVIIGHSERRLYFQKVMISWPKRQMRLLGKA